MIARDQGIKRLTIAHVRGIWGSLGAVPYCNVVSPEHKLTRAGGEGGERGQ